LAGIANQADNVWLRFSILSPATGSGNRDSVGIDNFSLSYTAVAGTEYFWTANGSTLGGSGTWNTGDTNWSSSTSSVTGVAWDSGKKGVFSGTGGSVTVDSVTANAGLQFTTNGYVLSGGTITLGGADAAANNITTASGVSAEIGSTLAGTTGLSKSGSGTLVLSGTNTFSGDLNLASGTLQIGADGALGNAANDLANNGTLKTTASVSLGAGRDISGSGTYDIASASTLTVNGNVNNTATTLANSGTLDLQGATRSLGTITLNSAATINASGAISATGLTAPGVTGGTATINPDIDFTSGDKTLNVGAGGTVDLNGALSNGGGTGRIAKTGSGTLVLSAANNMGGLRVGTSGSTPVDGGTVILENSVVGTQAQAIQHNYGTLRAASNLVFTNGLSIGGRTNGAAILAGSNMEFQGQSSFFRGTGTTGELVLNVENTTTFSGGFGGTSGGGTATGVTIGGNGHVIISGNSSLLPDTITLTDTVKLTLTNTIGGGVSIGNGVAATLGGSGGLLGSLFLGSDAKFIFDLNNTGLNALTVGDSATDTVSFGAGFGIDSLVGLDSSVANGTYTIIDGPATFDFANVSNLGSNNAVSLGDGKFAYFSEGSLQVNVVPEPSTYAMLALAGAGFAGYVIRRRRR
jgi:autotransporter-associated beta strand protein